MKKAEILNLLSQNYSQYASWALYDISDEQINNGTVKIEDVGFGIFIDRLQEKINFDDKPSLSSLLNLSHSMSQMITTILKGNPRQTKRFLNTFILRTKLASVAKIDIDIFVLIKLMLLEYFDTKLFKKLN